MRHYALTPQLQLCFDQVIQQYLQDNGGNLIIYLKAIDGCCAGAILQPCVQVGQPPEQLSGYQFLPGPGFNLYLSHEAGLLTGVFTLQLERLFFWKLLTIRKNT